MRLTHRCAECLTLLSGEPESGRTYCSNACRQRAYRRRMAGTPSKVSPQAKVLSNLPAQRDSFVGRERELGKLAALVRQHRLVTLSGGVGAGKTRLALAVASRVQRDLADRVLLVELESTADARFLPQTFAAALGVIERPDEPLRETIIATLRHMRALIVLDNCEHLLDACAELVEDLLRRCPDVVVLATSREALRLREEVTLRVDGLDVPDPASSRRTDAVRLFVDRARERVPEFRLTTADAAAVAVLCARLDGSPLAIELAARWIPVLPVTEICARLDERFDLLTMGGRTKPLRQRSLREAIDWSYWLLVPEERRVLRSLSVFVGEFDLEVARAVYTGSGDLGEILENLHAKSLVSMGSAPGRFRLLESIRLYAASRLEAAGELPSAKEALTRSFVDLASPFVQAPLAVPNEVHQKVLAHRDALRIVITWTSGDRRLLLSTALAVCTARMGFLADARKLLSEVLDDGVRRTAAHCAALDRLAWYTGFLLEHDAALRMALDALEIASVLADTPLITTCLTTLACIEQMSGKLELAAARRDVCLQLVRPLNQPAATAHCLVHLAWSVHLLGDDNRAAALAGEGVALCRTVDSPSRLGEALNVLGGILVELRRFDEAEAVFREVLHAGSAYPHNVPSAIEGLALIAAGRGKPARGSRLVAIAGAIREEIGLFGDPYWKRRVAVVVRDAESEAAPLTRAQAIAFALEDGRPDPDEAPPRGLDGLEYHLATLVAAGLTNPQIADRLGVSTRAVSTRLHALRHKLGVSSRQDIVRWVNGADFD
ncbi:Predicted ATPase [Amycolatopsis xylanica]|uniref:Predicted ATPase n=1 Tax=Amycolatopsis xylanica TaxID=589385 RepID=A0A1H3NMX0_9PSEU|nr:AAA family ATPase [Amycolatopsis xylanica]SDY90138.1 Predicted ATPase [Amycolatopsis xylanica]